MGEGIGVGRRPPEGPPGLPDCCVGVGKRPPDGPGPEFLGVGDTDALVGVTGAALKDLTPLGKRPAMNTSLTTLGQLFVGACPLVAQTLANSISLGTGKLTAGLP